MTDRDLDGTTSGAEPRSTRIVGRSPALLTALHLAEQAAPTDIPVLILGETGTGKELLAQFIHERSGRHGRIIDVDCGALPGELVEALLFGHRKGAFTGAVATTPGLIADADDGTLFLDELESLPLRGQATLLRVLETGKVRRIGDGRGRPVRFRLVAAAQDGLADMLYEGEFREDLVQRIAGAVIRLPALRDRGDDMLLAQRSIIVPHPVGGR